MDNCRVYEGHFQFESPTEVSVAGTQLTAKRIFINVGGRRAQRPAMLGLDQVDYLTNSSMMEIDFLPRHLVIVGGSYVGLEFGQMYRRFGSESKAPYTVIQRAVHIHPTVSELIPTMLGELQPLAND